MIIYRCVCCFKKYFSADVLICSVCNGDEFLKENLNLAHPESVIPPLPQPTNSSRKSTNPIGEVKIRAIGNSPCQREEVSSVGEDFIFPYEDSAINEFYRNDDVEASNFRSQNILLEQEQLLKNCSKNNTAMNTFLPGIQNSWCQTQTSNVHNKETETPLNLNYIVYPFSASSSKPQHLMNFYHQSSKQERENQSSMKRMLEKQITVESSEIESQDSRIDLTGSSLIAPESCTSHYVTENVINKKKLRDTNQKGSNSSDLLNKRGNSPNENFLPEEVSKQNACTSQQRKRIEGGANYRLKRLPTSKKGFKCWKCRIGFANESELNIHRKNVCEPNLYKCGKCFEDFSHDWKLKEHLVVHLEVKPFECEHCDLAYKWEKNLTSHMMKCHESEMEAYFSKKESKRGFKCRKCRKEFANESELNSHMQNHDKPKQNKSDQCSKEFSHYCRVNEVPEQEIHTSQQQTRIEGGENYRRKRLPTSKKGFKCWKCRKGFANESELNIHRKNVCEPNLYKCGKCSEEFSHDWKLKEHLVVHGEVKPFECEHCDLAFNKERYLTSHIKKYHESEMETYFSKPESKNDFKCGKCSRKFTNESELYDHLQQNSCDPNPCK
ncbi:Zinc finger protein 425 [Araneus ventricosus]|uniref:Zinc finger protein 425 n=1 Tax=Araneus ventricosus TaxID=182803 RepID=A0A4Y2Q608_ARAVE|nr:Zinc finger protein 425 [Araneus ventricosus]